MIQKLRLKFIALTLLSVFVLLSVIVTGMDLLSYRSVVDDADTILSLLSQNHGAFPKGGGGKPDWLPHGMSPELPYESRFFSVVLNSAGKVIHTETSRVIAVDADTARDYAEMVVREDGVSGFVGNFRYVRTIEGKNERITFLDCGRKIGAFRRFVAASIEMSLLGFLTTAVVVIFCSKRFIRPVAESYDKQKRFITDAGHEIKTPLTIISANADVLKMDIGENEYLDDIQQQTRRLTTLTNDLVYLAKMEESGSGPQMIQFPVSEIVLDAAEPFQTLAQTRKKDFLYQVQPMLSLRGNDKAITQLVSILMDNALKYSPEGSRVELRFEQQNRKLVLTVRNLSAAPVSPEDLRHVFDRFYRADPSRNSETGGHGIGLSLAQAIVTAHGGKIAASSPDGKTFVITASFPAQTA